MKMCLKYFRLECKRCVKVFGKSFASFLLILCIALAGVGAISHFLFQTGVFGELNVAICTGEEDEDAKLVSRYISTMESVKSICSFEYMDQDSALAALRQQDVQAVVKLPQAVYQDINTGKDTYAHIYVEENPPFRVKVFLELLSNGISLLQTAEAGTYAGLEIAEKYGSALPAHEVDDVIAYSYILTVLQRGDIFNNKIISPIGDMGFYEYYYCSFILLMLLLAGINFSFLYKKEAKSVEDKLKAYGVGRLEGAGIKIILMSLFLWMIALVCYGAGCMASEKSGKFFLYWDAWIIAGLCFLSMAFAAYFHFIYELAQGSGQGVVLLLGFGIFMVLVSGSIIPLSYLPGWVSALGRYLPVYTWSSYLKSLLFFQPEFEQLVKLAGSVVLLAGLGVLVSWKNT